MQDQAAVFATEAVNLQDVGAQRVPMLCALGEALLSVHARKNPQHDAWYVPEPLAEAEEGAEGGGEAEAGGEEAAAEEAAAEAEAKPAAAWEAAAPTREQGVAVLRSAMALGLAEGDYAATAEAATALGEAVGTAEPEDSAAALLVAQSCRASMELQATLEVGAGYLVTRAATL
jgi:hypothetical protein